MVDGQRAIDISLSPEVHTGTYFPQGAGNGGDFAFPTIIGNITFAGSDQSNLTRIFPHQASPDNKGPDAVVFNPANGTTNVALTGRVGIVFSDEIDTRTLNTSTLIVRETGSSTPLSGRYSHYRNIVNFWPDNQLNVDTTYEIVIPAGGVEDWSGNATETQFTSFFQPGRW